MSLPATRALKNSRRVCSTTYRKVSGAWNRKKKNSGYKIERVFKYLEHTFNSKGKENVLLKYHQEIIPSLKMIKEKNIINNSETIISEVETIISEVVIALNDASRNFQRFYQQIKL